MSDLTERLNAAERRYDISQVVLSHGSSSTASQLHRLSVSANDVPFLLDLAREQQAALDAVENLAKEWDVVFERFPAAAAGIFAKSHANRIREALEAKP